MLSCAVPRRSRQITDPRWLGLRESKMETSERTRPTLWMDADYPGLRGA
jgi:hypothetical protein